MNNLADQISQNKDDFISQLLTNLERSLPDFSMFRIGDEYKKVIDAVHIIDFQKIGNQYIAGIRFDYSDEASIPWSEYRDTQKSPFEVAMELKAEFKTIYERVINDPRILIVDGEDREYFLTWYERLDKEPYYNDEEKRAMLAKLMAQKAKHTIAKKKSQQRNLGLYSDIYIRFTINEGKIFPIECALLKIPKWQHKDLHKYNVWNEVKEFVDKLKNQIECIQNNRQGEHVKEHSVYNWSLLSKPIVVYGSFGTGKSTLVERLNDFAGISEEVHLSKEVLGISGSINWSEGYRFHGTRNVREGLSLEDLARFIFEQGTEIIVKDVEGALSNLDIQNRVNTRILVTERLRDISLSLNIPAIHSGNLLQMLFGTLAHYKFSPLWSLLRSQGSEDRWSKYSLIRLEKRLMKRLFNYPIPTEKEMAQMMDIFFKYPISEISEMSNVEYQPYLEDLKRILTTIRFESIPELWKIQQRFFQPGPDYKDLEEIFRFAEYTGIVDLLKEIFEYLGNPSTIIFTDVDEETRLEQMGLQNEENTKRRSTVISENNWFRIWDMISKIIIRHYFPNIKIVTYNWKNDPNAEKLKKEMIIKYSNKGNFNMWSALEKNVKNLYYFGHINYRKLKRGFDDLQKSEHIMDFINLVEQEIHSLVRTYFGNEYERYFSTYPTLQQKVCTYINILEEMEQQIFKIRDYPNDTTLSTYIQPPTSKKEPFRLLKQLMQSFERYLNECSTEV